MTNSIRIGIIGGTGVYQIPGVENLEKRKVDTPYGSVMVSIGILSGKTVAFLTRHGEHHSISPGQINYRANMYAMKSLGVKQLIATACSGSLNPEYGTGSFVMLEQFIELTRSRIDSFYQNDGSRDEKIAHVDMTTPYCGRLGQVVIDAGKEMGIEVKKGATYCCVEGPRFETKAEIDMIRRLGGDLVAQTQYPEVALAREAEICYAAIGVISNMAAGIEEEHVSAIELKNSMATLFNTVQILIAKAVERMDEKDTCWCQTALAESYL